MKDLMKSVVGGFEWSNDPESYAGGSVANGMVSLAGKVKGDEPDYERHPGPPEQGYGRAAGNLILEKCILLRWLKRIIPMDVKKDD
jgi:hypothetical protein